MTSVLSVVPYLRCKQRGSSTARHALALSFLAMLGLLNSCSTVSFSVDEDAGTEQGLRSTGVLRKVVSLPFAALSIFAQNSEDLLKRARSLEAIGKHGEAAACYLKAAVDAQRLLTDSSEVSGDADVQANLLKVHNSCLAKFAELTTENREILKGARTKLMSGSEMVEVELSENTDFGWGYFDSTIPAISVKGKGVVSKKRHGYGAALVGIRRNLPERKEEMEFHPPRGIHVAATLVVESVKPADDGYTHVTLSLRDPEIRQFVEFNGVRYPMAADFTAPVEMLLSGHNELLWGLEGFFNAEKRIKHSGLTLLHPYEPDKIPVILTHGLASVPIIWRDVMPEFMSEPEISSRYQFLVFTYPSSLSIAESAELFRDELVEIRQHYDPNGVHPLSTNLVAIGHSMGGILTHLLAVDIGDRFWNELSDVPFEEAELTDALRKQAESLVFFDPDPAIQRAVFISTPHGGADLAKANFAGFLSGFVKFPVEVVSVSADLLRDGVPSDFKVSYENKLTSVQSLAPDSPIVQAMSKSPYKKGVVYHSIIGDRGKGDSPNSSDGVVEYWSSHQEGAASELIVPTGHSAYKDPNAIAELKRILRLHVGIGR